MKTIFTVKDIATVVEMSKPAVEKRLKALKIAPRMIDVDGRMKKAFVGVRSTAKLCRDVNPEEISVRYADQNLRVIAGQDDVVRAWEAA